MENIFGRVTSYGYAGDPYGDSLTRAGSNAIGGQLTPGVSMAVSPDIERQLKSQGIKIGSPVSVIFQDGSSATRIWDDRTMQDAQATKKFGAPLTGRIDLHSPAGVSPLDGKKVAAIKAADSPASPEGLPLPEPETQGNTGTPGDTNALFHSEGLDKPKAGGYITPHQDPTDPLSKPEGLAAWDALRSSLGGTSQEQQRKVSAEEEKRKAAEEAKAAAAQADHMKIIAAMTQPGGRQSRFKDSLDAALRMMPS